MTDTSKISICSLNCQGLGNSGKRRDVLNYLRKRNFSIICLQDTHFTPDIEKVIYAEWEYRVIFNSYSSNSRGVAIFLRNTFQFTLHNHKADKSGNLILMDIEIENHRLTFVNIYAPNKDDPTFFENIKQLVDNQGNTDIIMLGDWNLLLDPAIDGKHYKHTNNPKARDKVLQIMSELNLCDVWRNEFPDSSRFTWRRQLHGGTVQSGRLDFILISESLMRFARDAKITPGYRSDHSIISVSLKFYESPRTRTFWKFNSSLLRNENFVLEIKNVMKEVKTKYALTPYNKANIDNIPNKDYQSTLNPQLFFEMLLLEIRSKTIAFSTALKKKEKTDMNRLISEIKYLEEHQPDTKFEEIRLKKEELQALRTKTMEGTMIRSRARWIEHGEKVSKYFCNLENRNFTSKIMTSLITNAGEELTESSQIVEEVKTFYSKLYKSREADIEDIDLGERLKADTPRLSEEEAEPLEGKIKVEEALRAIKNMKNNKSPGTDGFTAEFYKFFWKDIGDFLVKSINFAFENGELSVTQKEGLIICLPKKGKSKKYIKNWRPISLLNVSYKIASACIANRMKKVLPAIINLDQSGFMADRFIGDNIRTVYDVLHFAHLQGRPGILLLIDFEKAFDSIAWSFIQKCLSFFNFGMEVQRWIHIFYKNIKSRVIINNSVSQWFDIERGCRQGDSISPYIFLICGEVLAHMIRQNEHIVGYNIHELNIKISQYADDTSIFLDGSKDSFEYCVFTILEYAKYSGLAMNFEKTNVIWFGNNQNRDITYMPEMNFNWNPVEFTVLGVDFSRDLKDITDRNITKKLRSMRENLKHWENRDLTPFGKVTVLRSLIVSQIVHILTSLPSPSSRLFTEIQNMFYTFLWNGKPDKIKRTVSTQKLGKGGLNMIDIKVFEAALKTTWIKRIFQSRSPWRDIVVKQIPNMLRIPNFGAEYVKETKSKIKNTFWRDVLESYFQLCRAVKIDSREKASACSFLYNEYIKLNKRCIKHKTYIANKIYFIFQLKNGEKFLTYDAFKSKYNANVDFLTYTGTILAIKKYESKLSFIGMGSLNKSLRFQPALNIIMNTKKGSSPIYAEMISKCKIPNGLKKWQSSYCDQVINWENLFIHLKQTTNDTKLRWFQTRILHNILTTNRTVSKYNNDQSDLCEYCHSGSETITHLFWNCHIVRNFWENLEQQINSKCSHTHNFAFNEKLVLFGISNNIKTDKICDLVILMAKYYIYRCKVSKSNLSINHFKYQLYNRYLAEKEIIYRYKHEKLSNFQSLWHPYTNLFKSLMVPAVA